MYSHKPIHNTLGLLARLGETVDQYLLQFNKTLMSFLEMGKSGDCLAWQLAVNTVYMSKVNQLFSGLYK